ncbi:MAG: F0F1 ATP synthase subunit gamma [Spirochaetota bacterium]|jgi:F-type H+-transporting ATPase subunit gamma|nr:F0F1 ATP synthase subunit gamma [Spirochaetota bacterium]
MSRLLEIKRRIRSIKSLAKVTHAMELVTHTKIGRARKGALASRAYHESFAKLMGAVKSAYGEDELEMEDVLPQRPAGTPDSKNTDLVIFLSQKGFCGAFNDRLLQHIAQEILQFGETRLIVIGRVAPKWNSIMHTHPDLVIAAPDKNWQSDLASLAENLADRIAAARDGNKLIYFAYNRFKSMLEQIPVMEQIWPPQYEPEKTNVWRGAVVEPSPDAMMEQIALPWINASLARAWWETNAGENYARLISMKSANENASIIIDHLALQYNKTRQLVITQELSEITNAFNVLNILKTKREQGEV